MRASYDTDSGLRRRVELLPDVIFETDAAGALVFLGGAALALLGRPPSDCLRTPLLELLAPDSRAALADLLSQKSTGPRRLRIRLAHADGVAAWALMTLAPADSGGLVGTLHDIGAEKSAEDELAQLKEETAAAAAAKRVYIDNVSHEVRTPLAAIIGLSQLCLSRPPRTCIAFSTTFWIFQEWKPTA
jgi:PAS domain S-box-containing protein